MGEALKTGRGRDLEQLSPVVADLEGVGYASGEHDKAAWAGIEALVSAHDVEGAVEDVERFVFGVVDMGVGPTSGGMVCLRSVYAPPVSAWPSLIVIRVPRNHTPSPSSWPNLYPSQSVGYLVDSLEEFGYVERVTVPGDRRGRVVRLTLK